MDRMFCWRRALVALSMNPAKKTVSPALLKANRRLYELRQLVCPPGQADNKTADSQQAPPWDKVESEPTNEPLAAVPAHLGWGSARLTAVLRRRQGRLRKARETAGTSPEQIGREGSRSLKPRAVICPIFGALSSMRDRAGARGRSQKVRPAPAY
jgi:hypothetical protein